MRTRQKCVAIDTWRSLGCRTTPLEHWSRRKPTVEPRWAKQQTKKLRPKPTKINSFMSTFISSNTRCFCIPDKVFRHFHQCWQILSFIPLSDLWDRQKSKINTCCQYIGCIGSLVTLSLSRWELTSLLRHIRRQLSIWRTSTYRVATH